MSSWSQLEAYLKQQINDSLSKEVAKHVKEEIQTAISTEVYAAGTPKYYDRRGGNDYGGMGNPLGTDSLADTKEMNHTVINGELKVTDDAMPSSLWNMNLDEAITYGYGSKDQWWNEPRPFMSVAVENMKESNSHIEIMKEALEKRLGKGSVI